MCPNDGGMFPWRETYISQLLLRYGALVTGDVMYSILQYSYLQIYNQVTEVRLDCIVFSIWMGHV